MDTYNEHFRYFIHYVDTKKNDALIVLHRVDKRIKRSFYLSKCTATYNKEEHRLLITTENALRPEIKYQFNYVTGIPSDLYFKLIQNVPTP